MRILHIASIINNKFNGVCVAVPQHIAAQREIAEVALLNLREERIEGVERQFFCGATFDPEKLEEPFNKPDIVVFHEAYRVEYLKIYPQLLKRKIPYVIIPHGELSREAQKKKWLKKKVANLLLFNRFINRAAAVQCLSAREMAMTRFGKRRFVGSNGVFMPSKRKECFRSEGMKFVYIGRLEMHIKGLDLMLNAVKEKAELLRQKQCTLDIYGPDILGRAAAVAELIEQNGIGDIVTLHPPVTGEEKEKILLDADVFIQTSRSEGMPMGILEALSYGLPCLVTEGTTLAEFVSAHNAGWSCATSAKEIARTLERVFEENSQSMERSARAVSAIEASFSWGVVARNAVEQYGEMLK